MSELIVETGTDLSEPYPGIEMARPLSVAEESTPDKLKLLKVMGPGLVFASLVIGETHLALQAYAGALFGMTFLWLIILVHLVYYPIFEYGSRYAVATGESLVEGYWRIKYRKPLFWYFIVFMFVTPPLFMGSLVGLTGSVLNAAFPGISFTTWCVITFFVTTTLILVGRYRLIEIISKIIILLLVCITLLAVALSPPNMEDFLSGLVPQIPEAAGVWLVIIAMLRVPTDPAASIFLSQWVKEKRKDWGTNQEVLVNSMKKSIWDLRIGFVVSLFVAVAFMAMGTVVFKPRGIVPEGVEFALRLSEIFTETFGPWIFPVFIISAFVAFWGGYLSAQDGIHRLFQNVAGCLFNLGDKERKKIGDAYLIFVASAGLIMTTVLQRPMFMVLIALSMAFLYFPLVVGLNIYCVTRMVDKKFQPSKLNIGFSIMGLIFGLTGLVLLVLVRVLKVLS